MTITRIDKQSAITHQDFVSEYVEKSIPVVITDLTRKWPAIGKLTPEYFKNRYGNIENEVGGQIIRMDDYIDLMLSSSPENPSPYPYSFNVEETFPELLADFKPEMFYGKSDRVGHPLLPRSFLNGTIVHEMFFGGLGSGFPFVHIDVLSLHSQITQIYGDKEFFLFPPEQTPYLYPSETNPLICTVNNIFQPDYNRFPLFKKAEPLRVMVKEGETIYFPTGWWHTTVIHSPSISYGRVHLNAANWPMFISENYKKWKHNHSITAEFGAAYSGMLGKIMDLQEKLKRN